MDKKYPYIETKFYEPEQPKGVWYASIRISENCIVGGWDGDTEEEARERAARNFKRIILKFEEQDQFRKENEEKRELRSKTWWGRILNRFSN